LGWYSYTIKLTPLKRQNLEERTIQLKLRFIKIHMIMTNYPKVFLVFILLLSGCSKDATLEKSITDFGFKSVDNVLSFDDEIRVPTFTWITFVNRSTSSGATANYTWNFGNNTSSSDKSPIIQYFDAGIYNVTLSNTNEIQNLTKQKKVIVVDRYAEFVTLQANNIKDDKTLKDFNGKELEVFLRIYRPLNNTDKNLDSLDMVYESKAQSVIGLGQEIRTFVLPARKFTIVPSDAPINKHFIYEIFIKSDTHQKSLILNNPLIGRYGSYEENINETTEMKIFGSTANMTVVAKYDSK
jgi:hypothetical protein